MTHKSLLEFVLVVCVQCFILLECLQLGNCNETSKEREPYIDEIISYTEKTAEKPVALSMLNDEDHMGHMVFQPTIPPTTQTVPETTPIANNTNDEPKGRALNFTLEEHSHENGLVSNVSRFDKFGDLSDVSMDEDEVPIAPTAKILTSKMAESKNRTGVCEKGGLTYENGEKLENGCDSICTCLNGRMDCADRCSGPFFRRGKKIDDPLCSEKPADDPCCSILVCAADTETEPLEMCNYKNKTYHRGEKVEKDCDELCTCETGGKLACKKRCPPIDKTSDDKCVVIPDVKDPCCKTIVCDVTLDDVDHDHEKEPEGMTKYKIISAKYLNETTIKIKFDEEYNASQIMPLVEASRDKMSWEPHKVLLNNYIKVGKSDVLYVRLERSDELIAVQNYKLDKKPEKQKAEGCEYKGGTYKVGEEFHDECISFCACRESGVKCLKMECPTYFGVDVIDPTCVEWETVPSNFTPIAPNCCPEKLVCKNNGSCEYEGEMYQNWQQIPINVTGCDKRCYCEMGKIECQNICPPVPALPPSNLPCGAHSAFLGHNEDDCCLEWVCSGASPTQGNNTKGTNTSETNLANSTDTSFFGVPNKQPSKILGPLVVYTNKDNATKDATEQPITRDENPFFHKGTMQNPENEGHAKKPSAKKPVKEDSPYMGPINPDFKNPDFKNLAVPNKPNVLGPKGGKDKGKPNKNAPGMFVTPPSSIHENYIPEYHGGVPFAHAEDYPTPGGKIPKDGGHQLHIHGKGNHDEILQIINQHPEFANYPPGSVLEIHNVPTQQRPQFINPNGINPNGINQNGINPNVINPTGIHPNGINPNSLNPNAINPHAINPNTISHNTGRQPNIPYVINNHDQQNLPPGVHLEHLLQEIHKNQPNAFIPFPTHPHQQFATQHDGLFVAQPNGHIYNTRPHHNLTTSPTGLPGHVFPPGFPNVPPPFNQPQDGIIVHTLDALDAHTVRLAFTVPPVIVGLHGRVEVRYTHEASDDTNTWKQQVFAPPNDLIPTPQLEFDLVDLEPDTEYKIKIAITLRDMNNNPASRVYTIRTLKDTSSTLPPMLSIEPDLVITEINSTWVNIAWRKFWDNELQYIDGIQLRYREIDEKIYAATPLIHRAVQNYVIENLKPATKYEIGIFFIPFPGQTTELHAGHMIHFTTANKVDSYGFNVSLEISHIKPTSVEIAWSGVPYPEDKYVNIYRAIYQSDSGKGDSSTFKVAKRDAPAKTVIMDLKPGTRYRLWLEVYLTNGHIKTSNVQDFVTKPRSLASTSSSKSDKLERELPDDENYYGPLVIVAILAAIAIMCTLVLLLMLVRRHSQNKAAITTPPPRVSQSAYDNPTYKVEIQQETMNL